jgi:PAS domain-containing protein
VQLKVPLSEYFSGLKYLLVLNSTEKLENDLSLYLMQFRYHLRFRFSRRFLKINKSGCDLIGFSEENILYHNFDEFVHPDDKEIFNDQVTDLEKRESTFKFENRYVTSDGDTFGLVGIVTQP